LERICDVERVKCEEGAIDQVLAMSQGDMRKAITALQSSAQYNSGVVTKEAIVDLWGQPTDELIDTLWSAMSSGDLTALEVSCRCYGHS
jgi:replication factor C subunit 2/4